MDFLVQSDAGHHIARTFREQAEIAFLRSERTRHALPPQQLAHQVKPDYRDQHHQSDNKQHMSNGSVAPWSEHLILLHGCQNNDRKLVAPFVEAQPLQSIQWRFEIIHSACRVQQWFTKKTSIRNVTSDIAAVIR